jgi:hypothetical protein
MMIGLALASMAAAGPASAAFVVNVGAPISNVVGVGNDFAGNLTALGLDKMTADSATITLSGKATLTFDYIASESGFNNTFTAGALSYTETGNKLWSTPPVLIGSFVQAAGPINNWFFSSSGNPNGPFGIGHNAFGIFIPAHVGVGSTWSTSVLYLGFDDQPGKADDNHDDIIIRVTAIPFADPGGGAVPEPASWAMLIAGFGLVGAAQRRRKAVATA